MSRRRRLVAGAFVAVLLSAHGVAAQQPAALASLDDLRPLAAQIRAHSAPLLVLFSTPGCPFCREVRQNYLVPRVAEQQASKAPDLLLREVDITASTPLVGSDGRLTTHAEFAARFNVRVVPVVMLFDDRLQALAEPLVGIDRAGFYEGYLARAIEQAQQRLRR